MTAVLYNLIIRPLYLLFEFVFVKAYSLIGNYGLTIIVLSLTINFLVLPLYRRADAMQVEERDKEKAMERWIKHIKKTFTGDERYMMLTTYYRQNNYRPTDSLKGTISLLLQVPFFIAAYRFLSGLEQLRGVSFGPLRDLGAPDAMFSVLGITINVLPILMTTFNFISGAIYTKGMPAKNKIQLYGMALIFLALLYRSPSGLVFYWTLNNLFSLIKNIFYKLKNPAKVLSVLAAVCSPLLFILFFFIHPAQTIRKKLFIILFCIVLLLPLAFRSFASRIRWERIAAGQRRSNNYWPGVIYLTLLIGTLIPSAVIASSPADFIDWANYRNPLVYVGGTLSIAAGVFLIWFSVFYMLADKQYKVLIAGGVWVLALVFTIDYMFFGTNLGNMSSELVLNNEPVYPASAMVLNFVLICFIALLMMVVFFKFEKIVPIAYLALLVGTVVLSGNNVIKSQRTVISLSESYRESNAEQLSIPLSKNGNNVIVFMLDRSVGRYLPYLMNEKPELKEKLSGFTYYHNTVSTGTSTNTGSAGLFGGYEYSAYNMNVRSDELLADKQNEALKVMPVIFDDNDYEVTVCDPPYAGYSDYPDLSIYDEYPGISAYHANGRFDTGLKAERRNLVQRNFFCYSVFKVMPLGLQKIFYNGGKYNNTSNPDTDYTEKFINAYSVLTNLPVVTEILEDDTDTFLMINNDTAHEPCQLQTPDYIPVAHVDNTEFEKANSGRFTLDGVTLRTDTNWRLVHYYADMAAFLQLGRWFDYLKQQGVYDNTRIIVVSDHGYGLDQFSDMYSKEGFDLEWFNPVLLFKDFDAEEFTQSEEFMSNADTPVLAMSGLIENMTNPFTGNEISSDEKKDGLTVFHTENWKVSENNGTMFSDGDRNRWFTIKDNIWDSDNWVQIEDPFK